MGRQRRHALFTVLAKVAKGHSEALYAEIEAMGYAGTERAEDPLGLKRLGSLHYTSMFLYDDPEDGCLFVFEGNIDGRVDGFFAALEERLTGDGSLLASWRSLCSKLQGFEGSGAADLVRYLHCRVQPADLPYVGARGLTRNQILTDAAIREVVEGTLSALPEREDGERAMRQVLIALASDPRTERFYTAEGDSGSGIGPLATVGHLLVLLLTALVHVVLGLFNLSRERRAREEWRRPDPAEIRRQEAFEFHGAVNHMASITHIHPDAARRMAKRNVYVLLRSFVSLFYRKGSLGGIESIHFAHWRITNGGRRLLFVSNFDGDWDTYLDDFTLTGANNGLTAGWAHCTGFPRSVFMVFGGADHAPEFIDWARLSMVPCPLWYSAYPGLSMKTILQNRNLRRALTRARWYPGSARWLRYV